jgi:hypothetical protein
MKNISAVNVPLRLLLVSYLIYDLIFLEFLELSTSSTPKFGSASKEIQGETIELKRKNNLQMQAFTQFNE